MRHPFALLFIAVASCTGPHESSVARPTFDPATFGDAPSCEARPLGFDAPSSVERVVAASDSTLLIVYADARQVVVADGALRPLRRLRLDREGPTGIAGLTDAALLDNDLLVVADGPRRMVRAFDPEGALVWSTALPVMPDRLLATPAGIAVFPLVLSGLPGGGAYLVDGGEVRDLGVARIELKDPQMSTLANLVSPALVAGTGRLVAARQFIAPVATLLDLDEDVTSRTLPMPIAQATATEAWFTPSAPYAEEAMEKIIAPAMAATSGPETGEVSILTRSGARRDDHTEKVVVRLDDRLSVTGGWTVPVNAVQLAWLPAERAYYIMTADEAWFRCALPPSRLLTEGP